MRIRRFWILLFGIALTCGLVFAQQDEREKERSRHDRDDGGLWPTNSP